MFFNYYYHYYYLFYISNLQMRELLLVSRQPILCGVISKKGFLVAAGFEMRQSDSKDGAQF